MGKVRKYIQCVLAALLICLAYSGALAYDGNPSVNEGAKSKAEGSNTKAEGSNTKAEGSIKIAMLHLALNYADLKHNAALIESGIKLAARHRADWVMTPELSLTGYRFDLKIGIDWISNGPDYYVKQVQSLAKKHQVTVFLSHLERVASNSAQESDIFNTLFVIDQTGTIIGRHRKINTIPVAESWSKAGQMATVIEVDQHKVGLLICADAWPDFHARTLKAKGANLILSSASWAPGKYGPGDTWEKRSHETGLPLFVNNRTGIEREFDLSESTSVVSFQGRRLMSHQSRHSTLIMIEWDAKDHKLHSYKIHDLPVVAEK